MHELWWNTFFQTESLANSAEKMSLFHNFFHFSFIFPRIKNSMIDNSLNYRIGRITVTYGSISLSFGIGLSSESHGRIHLNNFGFIQNIFKVMSVYIGLPSRHLESCLVSFDYPNRFIELYGWKHTYLRFNRVFRWHSNWKKDLRLFSTLCKCCNLKTTEAFKKSKTYLDRHALNILSKTNKIYIQKINIYFVTVW